LFYISTEENKDRIKQTDLGEKLDWGVREERPLSIANQEEPSLQKHCR
jgi:hypothetical protein